MFFVFAVVLSLSAFAVDESDFASLVYVDGVGYMTYEEYLAYMPADTSAEPVESPVPVIEVDEDTANALFEAAAAIYDNAVSPVDVVEDSGEMTLSGIDLYYSDTPVTPSDANGFKSVLLSLLGNYDPVVVEYTYTNNNYTSKSIDITPDYAWLASAAILLVLIFCVFRAGGAVLCKR